MGLKLFGKLVKRQMESASDGLTTMLIKFDFDGATEEQLEELDKVLDEATRQMVQARNEWKREKSEADAAEAAYNLQVTVCEKLEEKLSNPDLDDTSRTSLEESLNETLAHLEEELGPERDREVQEAEEASSYLNELQTSVTQASTNLKEAKKRLTQMKRDLDRAQKKEEDENKKAERQKEIAGIKQRTSNLGSVFAVMEKETAKAQENAEVATEKRMSLESVSSTPASDKNVADILAEIKGGDKPVMSASERLAALKAKKVA